MLGVSRTSCRYTSGNNVAPEQIQGEVTDASVGLPLFGGGDHGSHRPENWSAGS